METYWEELPEFFRRFTERGLGLNYATFTGHGDLRARVVGRQDVAPTPGQLREMRQRLADSMDQGSLGLSSGLEYAPGCFARPGELTDLCRVVAEFGGIFSPPEWATTLLDFTRTRLLIGSTRLIRLPWCNLVRAS